MRISRTLRKRGLALFLALTMCLSLLPTPALAASEREDWGEQLSASALWELVAGQADETGLAKVTAHDLYHLAENAELVTVVNGDDVLAQIPDGEDITLFVTEDGAKAEDPNAEPEKAPAEEAAAAEEAKKAAEEAAAAEAAKAAEEAAAAEAAKAAEEAAEGDTLTADSEQMAGLVDVAVFVRYAEAEEDEVPEHVKSYLAAVNALPDDIVTAEDYDAVEAAMEGELYQFGLLMADDGSDYEYSGMAEAYMKLGRLSEQMGLGRPEPQAGYWDGNISFSEWNGYPDSFYDELKRPNRGSITKAVGEDGFYAFRAEKTLIGSICGHTFGKSYGKDYRIYSWGYESGAHVIGEEIDIAKNAVLVGGIQAPAITFTAEKPGTAEIWVQFLVNFHTSWDRITGSCPYCGRSTTAFNDNNWYLYTDYFTVTVNDAPTKPAKPTASTIGNAYVAVQCSDTAAHKAGGDGVPDYSLASNPNGWTAAEPVALSGSNIVDENDSTFADAGVQWKSTLTLKNSYWADKYDSTGHSLDESTGTVTITAYYYNNQWLFNSQDRVRTVRVKDATPEAPKRENLSALLGSFVQVKCVSTGTGLPHAAKTYSTNSYYSVNGKFESEIGQVYKDGDTYKVDVTLNGDVYAAFYGAEPVYGTGENHTLKTGESATKTITLTWNPNKNPTSTNAYMHWDSGLSKNTVLATFEVVCKTVTNTKYTVTYTDGVKGETVFGDESTEDLKAGDATPAFPGSPDREGYTFTGWTLNGALLTPAGTVKATVSADDADGNNEIVYTATWEETSVTYTLYYKANDGTDKTLWTDTQKKSASLTHPETFYLENIWDEDPTREGYTFTGWNTKADGTGDSPTPDGTYTITNGYEATLHAQWAPVALTVEKLPGILGSAFIKVKCVTPAAGPRHQEATYSAPVNGNGITVSEVSDSAPYTCTVTVAAAPFVTAYGNDHTLISTESATKIIGLKWNATEEKWEAVGANSVTFQVGCPDPETEYILTYDANGGTIKGEATWSDTQKSNRDYVRFTVISDVPVRTGYEFAGWVGSDGAPYSANGKVLIEKPATTETLTAQWTAKNYAYTVQWIDADTNELIQDETRQGTFNGEVEVRVEDKTLQYYDYCGDDHEGTILKAFVAESGTVLKLYFRSTLNLDGLEVTKTLTKVENVVGSEYKFQQLDKDLAARTVLPGSKVTYHLEVKNTTGAPVYVYLTDDMANGLLKYDGKTDVAGGSAPPPSPANAIALDGEDVPAPQNALTDVVRVLANGETMQLDYYAIVEGNIGQSITNTVTAAGIVPNGPTITAEDSETITVRAPKLGGTASKVHLTNGNMHTGEKNLVYTIIYTNTGEGKLKNFYLLDDMSKNLRLSDQEDPKVNTSFTTVPTYYSPADYG